MFISILLIAGDNARRDFPTEFFTAGRWVAGPSSIARLAGGKWRVEEILPLLIKTEKIGDEVHPLFEIRPIRRAGGV
jgi:hypothetical protein